MKDKIKQTILDILAEEIEEIVRGRTLNYE